MVVVAVGLEVAGGVDEVAASLGMAASGVNPCSMRVGMLL